jgi:hypothetical protein
MPDKDSDDKFAFRLDIQQRLAGGGEEYFRKRFRMMEGTLKLIDAVKQRVEQKKKAR